MATFDSPCDDPRGLAFDGTNLWVSDGFSEDLFWVMDTNGSVLDSVTSQTICEPGGMAMAGTYMAVLDSCLILSRMDTAGNIIDSFTAPTEIFYLWLAFDGTNYWGTSLFGKVFEFDNGSSIISSFFLNNYEAQGLATDGTDLWTFDFTQNEIVRFTKSGTVVESFTAPDDFLEDLAFDGTYLYGADTFSLKIYKMRVD